jgi:hypothetical protein
MKKSGEIRRPKLKTLKQATNIRLFNPAQIPHPRANLQKANARPWEQVQLKMPDKCPGGWGTHGID